ncbi:MAG TPA: phenylacetate-CoA oxygenase subunit PaaJ [Phycisphaerales bacterium]|nr:phenylacetate-CoA oxygenase subunit PaaJ [Phycisphaerales bacterium]HRQ75142.1 phenylacetate-CoA oxygenase subunit PaaJ [Phycisphaerales bacterium]
MPTREDILEQLRTIPDPEMPISIVDLGIIEQIDLTKGSKTRVSISILPTFVGCPALPMIEEQVREKIGKMVGVESVDVRFVFDPPWSVDRITQAGRESLKAHGVTVPERGSRLAVHGTAQLTTQLRTSAVPCPFCNSTSTYLESPFGPTRCRMIYYCEACKNSFEHLKRLA